MGKAGSVANLSRGVKNTEGAQDGVFASDIPLLLLVRDSGVITRDQMLRLVSSSRSDTYKRRLNRHIERLLAHEYIQEMSPIYPYSGRTFSVTVRGLVCLEMLGHGLLSLTSENFVSHDILQIGHALGLAEIRCTFARCDASSSWLSDSVLKSFNISSPNPTQKDYDAIVLTGTGVRIGVEYERTIKAKSRYAEIREALSFERELSFLFYFVDSEDARQVLNREIHTPSLAVGFVILKEFMAKGYASSVLIGGVSSPSVTTLESLLASKEVVP